MGTKAVTRAAKPLKPQHVKKNARQAAFLEAFKITASVSKAAKSARIDRTQHYRWLDEPDYVEQFQRATKAAASVLQDEAVRRAHDGIDEPVRYQGQVCGHVKRYSDVLLIFLLKGLDPARFGDRYEHRHEVGERTLEALVGRSWERQARDYPGSVPAVIEAELIDKDA